MTLAKPRILIVEDDHDLSEMLETYFQLQKYEVVRAAFGEDALALAQEGELSLILLDIRLPDISGYDVCRALRLNRRTQDTPILFLTEKRDRIDRLHGLELGVVDYITKPFDVQELRLRVRNAIQRAGLHSALDPVTGLPGAQLTGQRLAALPQVSTPWALLRLRIDGLARLREQAGFMAADDMMRAMAGLVSSIVREAGTPTDVVGHSADDELVVLTQPERLPAVRERIESRVRASLQQFDKPIDDARSASLSLEMVAIDSSAQPGSAHALREALGIRGGILPPDPI
jgi:DNA-binding response OmpR family regulator